jgi:hypothetical protein
VGIGIDGKGGSFLYLKSSNERYQPQGKPRTLSSAASGGVLNSKGIKKQREIDKVIKPI